MTLAVYKNNYFDWNLFIGRAALTSLDIINRIDSNTIWQIRKES